MQEVAEICFVKLNLILIAIEARKYEGGGILINPSNVRVAPNTIGLFLTESSDAAKRAWFYCRKVGKKHLAKYITTLITIGSAI